MRDIKVINGNWRFSFDTKSIPVEMPASWDTVTLPHTWNGTDGQDGGNDYKRCKALYCKEFSAEDFTNDEAYIEFDGVNSSSEIFWNGKSLLVHHGGYSRFRVHIAKELIEEKNILCVLADNSPNNTVYPQVADFTFYGGIYRSVKLICVSNAHFDLDYMGAPGIMVTPQVNGSRADVNIKAFTKNADGKKVVFKVIDSDMVVGEAVVDANTPEATVKIDNVHLWNGRKDPHIYTVEAFLMDGEEVLDNVSTRFGCRTFEIDPEKGFILNGAEYPLRGVSRHQDYPVKGNALSIEDHKRDIDLIMEVGATTIRLAHYQHAQEFYDLCDEKGLVIWAEIPYISNHMPEGKENTLTQMEELVAQNYNHPSIVVWGLSNEITMAGASDPTLIENHRLLNDLVHKMDKTRLTTLAAVTMCGIDEKVVHLTDVVSYNHYFGWYGGTTDMNGRWFDDFHKKYPNRPIGISEYGCEALNWHTSTPEQGDYTEEYQSYYHEELIKQIADRPYLWATHVWNMFDFAADARAEGGENGMNHKGLITFDRQYKKDSFFAYKAWLSDEKVLHICSKRYIDRVEDVTKVTVYSNCAEVELFANGVSVGKQSKGKYPFFYFEVENKGETTLVAKADDLTDEAVIRKVSEPNADYIMQDTNGVINWFEITTPPGYLSINDTIGDILAPFRGKLFALSLLPQIKKILAGDSKGEDGESKGMSVAGFKLNRNIIDMAKGFTLKRIFLMMSDKFPKEFILEVNAKLNKIKKKTK